MQKVEGSSPFIRFGKAPGIGAFRERRDEAARLALAFADDPDYVLASSE